MKTTTTTLSRRAILGAMAVAMPVATFAAVGNAVERQDERNAGVSPELPGLIAAAHAADNACRDYAETAERPAHARWLKLCERIPHTEIEASYGRINEAGARVISTEDDYHVRAARSAVRTKVSFWGPGSEDARQRHEHQRQLVAAANARDARVAAAAKVSGLTAVLAHMEGLEGRATEAVKAVDAFNPRSLADLVAKLDYYEDVGSSEDNDVAAILAVDIRHLFDLTTGKVA